MNITMVATTTVVGSLTATEVIERNKLTALGHTVTLRSHTDLAPASFSGIDLVFLSSSATSNQVNPKYDAVACGVATWDARKFPHSFISSQNYASTANQRQLYWFLADSDGISTPLNTGAEITVYAAVPTDGYAFVSSGTQLPASAKQWYKRDSASTDIIGFGFAVGAAMSDASLNAGGRKAVIGIQNPGEVTTSNIDSYIQRVLTWVSNGGNAPPAGDVTVPSQATLGASGSGTSRILTATATDNVAVTGYRFHQDTVNNFTPTGVAGGSGNCIAVDADGVYTVSGLTIGVTYYFKAVAVDAAGNAGPASAQLTVVATAPVIPPTAYIATSGVASTVTAGIYFATSGVASVRVDNT